MQNKDCLLDGRTLNLEGSEGASDPGEQVLIRNQHTFRQQKLASSSLMGCYLGLRTLLVRDSIRGSQPPYEWLVSGPENC